MVAAKVVVSNGGATSSTLSSAGSEHAMAQAEQELVDEACVMAYVGQHAHLAGLVGVVTRGRPKIIVLQLCEHGALLNQLTKRAAAGKCGYAATSDSFAESERRGVFPPRFC